MKKKFLSRKFLLKIFSLMASIFIWMYVVSSAEILINKAVPLNIELPTGLAVSNEYSKEIHFRFKGPGLFVRKFIERDLTINVKKSKYFKRGIKKYNIRLDQYKFKLPLGVELISMEPRSLQINLENSIEKMVKVNPIFSQKIQDEYNVKEIKVFPKKVKISGPRSVVRKIKQLDTKIVEELGESSDAGFAVDLNTPDSRVEVHEESVDISYTLQSKNIEFTYTEVPIIFQSVKLIKSVKPSVVNVKVYGEESKIKQLSKDSIQVIGYIPKDASKRAEIELITEFPIGIKVLDLSPKKVTVELE